MYVYYTEMYNVIYHAMNVHMLAARVLCLSPKRPGKYQETSPNLAFEETCPERHFKSANGWRQLPWTNRTSGKVGQKFQIFNSLLKGIQKKRCNTDLKSRVSKHISSMMIDKYVRANNPNAASCKGYVVEAIHLCISYIYSHTYT